MRIIDTHQHLWDLEQFSYSWTRQQPALNRSFRLADYLAATDGLEVVKSVHVEADVDEPFMLAETQHILALSEQDNPLCGVIACGRPEYESFPDYLRQIQHPNLKGVRRLLQSEPDELSARTLFLENVRRLADYGLSFDICVQARQLPVAFKLIERCPNVQFILDHCGNPLIGDNDLTGWRADLAAIAQLPNVVCKVSGIVTNAAANWTAADLRPAVEHVIACFGWERVMFGSDWPVCTLTASFAQWVQALREITQDAEEAQQRKLWRENAERLYRLA